MLESPARLAKRTRGHKRDAYTVNKLFKLEINYCWKVLDLKSWKRLYDRPSETQLYMYININIKLHVNMYIYFIRALERFTILTRKRRSRELNSDKSRVTRYLSSLFFFLSRPIVDIRFRFFRESDGRACARDSYNVKSYSIWFDLLKVRAHCSNITRIHRIQDVPRKYRFSWTISYILLFILLLFYQLSRRIVKK
jgi:hypothetical protein